MGPHPEARSPLPRADQVSVITTDRIIMFVSLLPSPSPLIIMFYRFGGGESLDGGSQITYVSSVNGTPTKDIHDVTDEDSNMTYTGDGMNPIH